MKYYPVYLDLRERHCVVAGGGPVAERKTLSLLEAGADVTVVSPSLTPKLKQLSLSGKILHKPKSFEEHDLVGVYLAVAATDSDDVNSAIGKLCRKKHILANVASPPEDGAFIAPSVVERGSLLIAVSTSGASPALAAKIREELESRYGPEYEQFLDKMQQVRRLLTEQTAEEAERRKILQALVDSDVLDLLRQGRTHEADLEIARVSGLKMR